jgi:putative salt-induced outer membrane protein YdiY
MIAPSNRGMLLWVVGGGLSGAMLAVMPACADVIRLPSGEVLKNVTILETTDDVIRFAHPLLGDLTVPRAGVIIEPDLPENKEPPAPAAAEGAASVEPDVAIPTPIEAPAAVEPPPPPPKEWKFKLVLAAALTEGNTENGSGTGLFEAAREQEETKLLLDTGYFFAQSNGDRTTNRYTAGFRHDWLNPGSKWFFFADGRYDWDEFQSWDQRANAHAGIGYRLIEPPKFKLNLLAGLGAVKEWGSDNTDLRPEALVGIEGQYDFTDKHSVKFDSTIFPDLNDLGEYRWVNNMAWSWLLETDEKLSLTAGLQHEYQSQVDEGREKNDLRLYAGLQLDW